VHKETGASPLRGAEDVEFDQSRAPWEGLRDGSGAVGSMVEATLILDALIIALIFVGFVMSRLSRQDVHLRLDDTIEGVAMLANELLKRTDFIHDMGSRMAPAIELHNHNPLEQVFSFLRALKTGDFSNISPQETNINPRDSHGQYAPALEEEEFTATPETIDIID
jgi:hypothetical protein